MANEKITILPSGSTDFGEQPTPAFLTPVPQPPPPAAPAPPASAAPTPAPTPTAKTR